MTARWAVVAALVATALSAWLATTRLRLSTDMTALFPARPEVAALARFARAFGGGDVAIVLVRADDAGAARAAADDVARALAAALGDADVIARAEPVHPGDPTAAWRWAGPEARARLARAVTPEGMRERLRDTRALLLAPGSAGAADWLARDPLRLGAIPWEGRGELAAGVRPDEAGALVADEGRARLVIVRTRGRALESSEAASFVTKVDAAFADVRTRHPSATIALTGGHAMAVETERAMKRDLGLSAALSTALASFLFLATFRRARALVAILPPLALGTLWTTGLFAVFARDLSAVATAFAAIVVGVGVDTGVHVYAALLDARREGLSPSSAAREARLRTWRPTMAAATVAAMAFGSLALSDLPAMRQLGVLCAAGEVLTAVGILGVTPAVGAWLERGAPPKELAWPLERVGRLSPRAARLVLALALVPALALGVLGFPDTRGAIGAARPLDLPAARAQDDVYRLFGGRPGQWVVLSIDRDSARARERGDRVAEALEPLAAAGTVDGFDALASWAPALSTQEARLEARDALRLPDRRAALESALRDEGFDVDACAAALEAFARPSRDTSDALDAESPALAWLRARHVASDRGETLAVTYVRARGEAAADAKAREAILAADPGAIITGYAELDRALQESLGRELPRIGAVALVLVALGLRAALRRARDVAIALATLFVELSIVIASMRVLGIRLHVYDALVLPVLVGITVDEVMFLVFEVRRTGEGALGAALARQAPLVAATALSTAGGFGALVVCRFGGLRDLGAVGAIGSAAGLACALLLVPAALRARGRS